MSTASGLKWNNTLVYMHHSLRILAVDFQWHEPQPKYEINHKYLLVPTKKTQRAAAEVVPVEEGAASVVLAVDVSVGLGEEAPMRRG